MHVLAEGYSHGECGFSLRMAGADAIFVLGDAERVEIGLNGGGAVHAPGGVDEGLDEMGFGGAFGLVFVEEGMGVPLIRGIVLSGEDDGLAGDAVAERVQFGALLPGFGTWASGF